MSDDRGHFRRIKRKRIVAINPWGGGDFGDAYSPKWLLKILWAYHQSVDGWFSVPTVKHISRSVWVHNIVHESNRRSRKSQSALDSRDIRYLYGNSIAMSVGRKVEL